MAHNQQRWSDIERRGAPLRSQRHAVRSNFTACFVPAVKGAAQHSRPRWCTANHIPAEMKRKTSFNLSRERVWIQWGARRGRFMVSTGGKLGIGFALLIVSTSAMAAFEGEDLRLVGTGSAAANPTPGAVDALPLIPAQRLVLKEAIKANDYSRAETILADEIEKNPKAPQLLTFLASLFFLDGKYLNTAIALKKAEAIEPLDSPSRFTLALSYVILDHRDWARPELEKLARDKPRDPLYPYWLGRLDYDAMNFTAALGNLRKAIELDPSFTKTYENLGLTYEALGRYDDAIRTYQQAVDLNRRQPTPSPWPPLNFGSLLIKMDRLKEAETCLQESLRYEPRFPKAHFQMGVLLEREKKDDEATRELGLSIAFDPADPEPHYVLGRIYQRTGNRSKAEAEWQTFQKLKNEHPRLRPH